MSRLLFPLNNAPDDEADDVRQLMNDHGFSVYETHAGRWGLSVAAIWIKDENQYDAARDVIREYEVQRSDRLKQEYRELEEQGVRPNVLQRFVDSPLEVLMLIFAIVFILGLSLYPFYGGDLFS